MSRIDRGKKITLTFKEKGANGRATLVIDVSADDDILPHEHREDMRSIAAAILQVPVTSLADVEVELKKTGGDHSHPGDHDHDHGHEHAHAHPVSLPSDTSSDDKLKA
jgi:ABC-type Zn2+ transport system substrate-binding protein/surface adhesin